MSAGGDQRDEAAASAERLARALPRILIATDCAEAIASDWIERLNRATAARQPPFARYPFAAEIREGLFEARRAGRVVRGLEGAEEALEREEAGLRRTAAARPDPNQPRISRLLVLAADGAPRFYRQVERLRSRHETRLEALVVETDEVGLGAATYGGDRRARAILLDHKDAVARFLEILHDVQAEGGFDA